MNYCSICLDDLQKDPILSLKCRHLFHKNCMIDRVRRCPICRAEKNILNDEVLMISDEIGDEEKLILFFIESLRK